MGSISSRLGPELLEAAVELSRWNGIKEVLPWLAFYIQPRIVDMGQEPITGQLDISVAGSCKGLLPE